MYGTVPDPERDLLLLGDGAFHVTGDGRSWLAGLGVEVPRSSGCGAAARACLDWRERRPHLAGALGAALADVFFARGFVRRLPGGRAIAVTPAGDAWLMRELGLGRLS